MSHRGRIHEGSQDALILAHLQTGAEIDPLTALHKFGCFRLGARIHCLRGAGVAIDARMVRNGRKFHAVYKLGGNANG